MENLSITWRKADIIAALSEIEQIAGIDKVDLTYKEAENRFISRKPQNQFEMFDAVLAFSISVAAAAGYDAIKYAIIAILKKNDVVEKDSRDE